MTIIATKGIETTKNTNQVMTSIKVILCFIIVTSAFYNTDLKFYQQDFVPKDKNAILSVFEATVVIYVGFAGFDILT